MPPKESIFTLSYLHKIIRIGMHCINFRFYLSDFQLTMRQLILVGIDYGLQMLRYLQVSIFINNLHFQATLIVPRTVLLRCRGRHTRCIKSSFTILLLLEQIKMYDISSIDYSLRELVNIQREHSLTYLRKILFIPFQ